MTLWFALGALTWAATPGSADEAELEAPFYPGADYDPAITTPSECLGFPLGSRLARPERVVSCFRTWATESDQVSVERYARSHEGRELVRAVITSAENHARLDEILADVGRLADPRELSESDLARIVDTTPAVAWFGYSIHGNETSGVDASLAFGHHLIAHRDDETAALLEQTVVIIDPVMNPDGRVRTIDLVRQLDGAVPSLNHTGMQRGTWPWGRGNHYLFDLNRDWIVGSQPETRGRWQQILRFRPQVFVDAHEMWANDTYLFYPRREPINPHFPERLTQWHQVFAKDQGAALDRYGWPYYTREWAEGWYPGYSDSWSALLGGIGLLYEQSNTSGRPLRVVTGRVVTYHEKVQGQAVSSLANLKTLVAHRREVLTDFAAHYEAAAQGPRRTFVLRPGRAPDREQAFLEALLRQGIEVWRAESAFTGRNTHSPLGSREPVRFDADVYLVDAAQPHGKLARALLEFDPRFSAEALQEERRKLEQDGASGIYDVTAWNLGMASGLDVYWVNTPRIPRSQLTHLPDAPDGLVPGDAVAWVVDGANDASVAFASRALEAGLVVHVADRTFTVAETTHAPGSLLIRRIENPAGCEQTLDHLAHQTGVQVFPAATSRSPDTGPDLGGEHFHLLQRPRVAVLASTPVFPSDYGHLWHHLDREVQLPLTLLDAKGLAGSDLRPYNVLVVPPLWDPTPLFEAADALATWVSGGGTLIALGSSAAALASEPMGLSAVRLRRDVLSDLQAYELPVQRWFDSRSISVDEQALWSYSPTAPSIEPEGAATGPSFPSGPAGDAARAEHDAWMRRFSPTGSFLRGVVDDTHWLGLGLPAELPVLTLGSHALLTPEGVDVPVRLGRADGLRLSGLLWPEARERLATTAWATVEPKGAGQVILFATPPTFRAQLSGTARLLSNAVVYGPGVGASQPQEW